MLQTLSGGWVQISTTTLRSNPERSPCSSLVVFPCAELVFVRIHIYSFATKANPFHLQPQTLLCYEMSGEAISEEHGAPLRLCIPTKYGIKNIKQIGKIEYRAERPKDYWAERGYDWFAGL